MRGRSGTRWSRATERARRLGQHDDAGVALPRRELHAHEVGAGAEAREIERRAVLTGGHLGAREFHQPAPGEVEQLEPYRRGSSQIEADFGPAARRANGIGAYPAQSIDRGQPGGKGTIPRRLRRGAGQAPKRRIVPEEDL